MLIRIIAFAFSVFFVLLGANKIRDTNIHSKLKGKPLLVALLSTINSSKNKDAIRIDLNGIEKTIDVSDSFLSKNKGKDSVIIFYDAERNIAYDPKLNRTIDYYGGAVVIIVGLLGLYGVVRNKN